MNDRKKQKFEVDFLRKKENVKQSYFMKPTVPNVQNVTRNQILRIVVDRSLCRDRMVFPSLNDEEGIE